MYYDLLSEPHLFGLPTLMALFLASIFIRSLPAFFLQQAAMITSSVLEPSVATEAPAIRVPSVAVCLKTMTKATSSGQGIADTAHARPGVRWRQRRRNPGSDGCCSRFRTDLYELDGYSFTCSTLCQHRNQAQDTGDRQEDRRGAHDRHLLRRTHSAAASGAV